MSVSAERALVITDVAAVTTKQTSLPAGPAQPPGTRPVSRAARRSAAAGGGVARLAFIALSILALGYGWMLAVREEFIPNEGVGYWLGIAGGSTLLFQLAYPLRKRLRFMRRLGSAPAWFRLHMFLGIVGPILILYHSNFSLGATNSNVALFTMLIVAASGIVGRYFYGKIHNGLYGAHASLNDLLAEATSMIMAVEVDVSDASGSIARMLNDFSARVMKPRRSLAANFAMAFWLGATLPVTRWRMVAAANAAIRRSAARLDWDRRTRRAHARAARAHIASSLEAVVKASELSFYERLFGLWHIFHMPLFFLLIVTGIVHVVAVHLY